MFLCIEELTWNEAMNVTRVFNWNPGRIMFHLGSHFVSRDFFIYHLNRTHVTSKWRLVEFDRSKYGRVMAIYPIACGITATRRKKVSFRLLFFPIGD